MSSPLLFFIFIIVVDLILKSLRDKKKIEKTKQKRQQELRTDSVRKSSYEDSQTSSSRNIMSTLREEIEKERLKEIARRQERVENIKPKVEQKPVIKNYKEKEYWDKKKEQDVLREKNIHTPTETKPVEVDINKKRIKEDMVRGIIFSEILSEPKSIQNQKRSM